MGIGANVTAYSVAREMILDDISAVQPDRLARIESGVTYAYRDLRSAGVFQDLAFDTGFHQATWQRSGRNGVIWAMDTSPNFFDLLGIHPSVGRLYTQNDEGSPVAVVSRRKCKLLHDLPLDDLIAYCA